MQGLPPTRPTACACELRMRGEMRVHRVSVAEQQRRVEVRTRDRRMQLEQAFGAVWAFAGRRFEEAIERRAKFEAQLFDALAQRVPRVESVLARDHGLRIVQRERTPGERR